MIESISNNSSYARNSKTEELKERFEQIKDKQGFLGSIWNDIKETMNLGQSEKDCESMLDKYNKGEVSLEEAVDYIENFEKKQENSTELIANIATGVGAITTATMAASAGPIGWALAIAKGAPVGAILKTGIKTLDRATNNIENDEINAKQMTKDAISGAVTGATSAITSGVGAGVKTGKFGLSVANGTKCSSICGAISGAASYTTDTMLDKDKDFNLKDFAKNTATSTLVSGSVGAMVGGGIYGIEGALGNIGKETTKNTAQTIFSDSLASSTRKVLNSAENNILAA